MSVGVVLLIHAWFNRAEQVARHWVAGGCPVVIHVDSKVPEDTYQTFKDALSDVKDIRFAKRHRCEWGTWGLVQATQDASQLMLDEFPDVRHVYLASGACLPLRPVEDLTDYLAARPRTDFIESVTTEYVMWTIGGLDAERFTLRFPFSWRRNRRLFDAYVGLQRKLRIKRRLPKGMVPHLGSQWWCLTRQTLSAILEDPQRATYDKYFRRVWIPDESYFQTLARLYSTDIESRSLTLSKFDFQGKPHLFYDDHLQLLKRSDCFVARKIWPFADRLYEEFLTPGRTNLIPAEPSPSKIDRVFAKAIDRRVHGRPGLYMQGRYPKPGYEQGITASPYAVFHGFTDIFQGFEKWLSRNAGLQAHGHLFGPQRVEFANDETVFAGALSDSAMLRDYAPKAFLTNLLWNARGQRQAFQFSPRDNQSILELVNADSNAQFNAVTGSWAITLFHSNMKFSEIRKEAARLQRVETRMVDRLRKHDTKARVRIWTLAEFLEAPMDYLQLTAENIGTDVKLIKDVPVLAEIGGFDRFLQNLRNQGMNPYMVGDFHPDLEENGGPRGHRPYLVT
jgi:hypothetical protein